MTCVKFLPSKSLVNDILLKKYHVSKPRGLVFANPLYQYNETNVLHLSFSLLRIKGLYMFQALLAHPQKTLHRRNLVYFVRIMSVGYGTATVKLQPCHTPSSCQHPIYCT
jgi:hypothetical protein